MNSSLYKKYLSNSTNELVAIMYANLLYIESNKFTETAKLKFKDDFNTALKVLVQKISAFPIEIEILNTKLSSEYRFNEIIKHKLAQYYEREIIFLDKAAFDYSKDLIAEKQVEIKNKINKDGSNWASQFNVTQSLTESINSLSKFRGHLNNKPQSQMDPDDKTAPLKNHNISWIDYRNCLTNAIQSLTENKSAKVFTESNVIVSFFKNAVNAACEGLGFAPVFAQQHFKNTFEQIRAYAETQTPEEISKGADKDELDPDYERKNNKMV